MAVIKTVRTSTLRLTVQTGINQDNGRAINRSRSFAWLNPDATDEAVFEVAGGLGELQKHPVTNISRVVDYGLLG